MRVLQQTNEGRRLVDRPSLLPPDVLCAARLQITEVKHLQFQRSLSAARRAFCEKLKTHFSLLFPFYLTSATDVYTTTAICLTSSLLHRRRGRRAGIATFVLGTLRRGERSNAPTLPPGSCFDCTRIVGLLLQKTFQHFIDNSPANFQCPCLEKKMLMNSEQRSASSHANASKRQHNAVRLRSQTDVNGRLGTWCRTL